LRSRLFGHPFLDPFLDFLDPFFDPEPMVERLLDRLIDIIVTGDGRDTEILPYEDPIVKKKCRHYSYILVSNALKMGYEEVEIAKIIALIGTTVNFDTECLVYFLRQSRNTKEQIKKADTVRKRAESPANI
jgi:hypothetical protein